METLGELVKTWREASGLKHPEMARLIGNGVKYQNLQQLESGQAKHPKYLASLAKFMGCTVDDLLALRMPPPRAAGSAVATNPQPAAANDQPPPSQPAETTPLEKEILNDYREKIAENERLRAQLAAEDLIEPKALRYALRLTRETDPAVKAEAYKALEEVLVHRAKLVADEPPSFADAGTTEAAAVTAIPQKPARAARSVKGGLKGLTEKRAAAAKQSRGGAQ